jgi:peptide/nickel transport system permease protein
MSNGSGGGLARFVLRRLIAAFLLLLLVLTATFAVLHLAPGEPESLLADPRVPPAQRAALAALWRLDQPLPVQYMDWLTRAAQGDWGTSFLYRRPVTRVVLGALPYTLVLGLAALGIQLVVGVPLGLLAAARPRSWIDRALRLGSAFTHSLPTFWLALMALAVLSFGQGWFPSSHAASPDAAQWSLARRFLDFGHHLALPALVLGIGAAGGWLRFVRAGARQTLVRPHVLTARAKGLSRGRILWAHVVLPSLAPWLQLLGLTLPGLLSGALVVEVVFSWPGLGRVAWAALVGRDYPLILACTTWSALLVVLGTLSADLLAAWADPRVREAIR